MSVTKYDVDKMRAVAHILAGEVYYLAGDGIQNPVSLICLDEAIRNEETARGWDADGETGAARRARCQIGSYLMDAARIERMDGNDAVADALENICLGDE